MLGCTDEKMHISNDNKGDRIKVLFFSASLFFLFTFIFKPYWGSNDDLGFLCQFSGIQTGKPIDDVFFMSLIISKLLCFLYTCNTSIAWYPIMHILLQFTSWMIISYVIYDIIASRYNYIEGHSHRFAYSYSLKRIYVFLLALFLFLYCYHFVNIQFTTTGPYCGAACLCLIVYNFYFNKKSWILFFFFCVLCFFSIGIRYEIAYVTDCAYLVTLFCLFARKIKRKKVKESVMSVIQEHGTSLVVFLLMIVITNFLFFVPRFSYLEKNARWEDMMHEVSSYEDYQHGTYEEDKNKYVEAGWTEELYTVVHRWYLIDENTNYESLKKINGVITKYADINNGILNKIKQMIITVLGCGYRSLITLFVCSVVVVFYWLSCKKWSHYKRFIVLIPILCLGLLLLLLCLRGRITDRVMDSLICLYITSGLLLFLTEDSEELDTIPRNRYCVIVGLIICSIIVNVVTIAPRTMGEKNTNELMSLWEYGAQNEHLFIVYDTSFTPTKQLFFDTEKCTGNGNVMFWGPNTENPIYLEQIHNKNYETFNTSNLFDDNVVYAVRNEFDQNFKKYLDKKYSNDWKYYTYDETDEFKIYKLCR